MLLLVSPCYQVKHKAAYPKLTEDLALVGWEFPHMDSWPAVTFVLRARGQDLAYCSYQNRCSLRDCNIILEVYCHLFGGEMIILSFIDMNTDNFGTGRFFTYNSKDKWALQAFMKTPDLKFLVCKVPNILDCHSIDQNT